MRVLSLIAAAVIAFSPTSTARADESNKLTYLTFTKTIQLPGLMLSPGRYRFELADPVESRRVIKVANEDGTKQIGVLLTVPNTLRASARSSLVQAHKTPAGESYAVRA